jgi:hypothetical protein
MPRGFLRFLRGNTIALLALFIALGGTTYAATALPKNSVGTKQLKKNAVTALKIKNGNVTGPKLKNGAVTNAKIAGNAVTGAKVKDDSLTGADVLESSLGTVPSATAATNAATAANALALGGYAAGELTRSASTSSPGDHAIGAGGTLDAISTTLTVPKTSNVLVIASGYAYAQGAAGCPCVLQGHLRQDSDAVVTSTTLVANTNLAGDAGDLIGGYDRRYFGGARLFTSTPGTHTYKFTVVRQSGTSATIGAGYLHLTAILLPFGDTGVAPAAAAAAAHAAPAPSAR